MSIFNRIRKIDVKKRNGWIKAHIAIDANSFNLVSLSIADEKEHD